MRGKKAFRRLLEALDQGPGEELTRSSNAPGRRKRQTPPRVRGGGGGDLALMHEDVYPGQSRKRSLIVDLRPGRDGKVWTVLLRMSDGECNWSYLCKSTRNEDLYTSQ